MPWNMKDYPVSLKNFDPLLRKKIIDIANALVANGYDDNRAIPIATAQGKEWMEQATEEELSELKAESAPEKDDVHDTSSAKPELLDEDVEVYYEDNEWEVKTKKADRAAGNYKTKSEAIQRAKEIAANKETQVIKYTKEGKRQDN